MHSELKSKWNPTGCSCISTRNIHINGNNITRYILGKTTHTPVVYLSIQSVIRILQHFFCTESVRLLHYVFRKYRVLHFSLYWKQRWYGTCVWNVFTVLILLFGVPFDLETQNGGESKSSHRYQRPFWRSSYMLISRRLDANFDPRWAEKSVGKWPRTRRRQLHRRLKPAVDSSETFEIDSIG